MTRFLDLMRAHGGPDGMIKNGIPWEKIVWGSPLGTGKGYCIICQQKDEKGEVHFFLEDNEGNWNEYRKKYLAYLYDLYDKDGKLLSISFFALEK